MRIRIALALAIIACMGAQAVMAAGAVPLRQSTTATVNICLFQDETGTNPGAEHTGETLAAAEVFLSKNGGGPSRRSRRCCRRSCRWLVWRSREQATGCGLHAASRRPQAARWSPPLRAITST